MRISEIIPFLQPAVEPGVINAGDSEAAAGSSEFQAIIDQMTGSEENKAAETTARPKIENPANAHPMSMLFAELTFDGAVNEADQKLQNAACLPVIPMPVTASLPAEKAEDPKPLAESGGGKAAIVDIAQTLAADVITQSVPTVLEKSTEFVNVAIVPSDLAEPEAAGTAASQQEQVTMQIATGLSPDGSAPALIGKGGTTVEQSHPDFSVDGTFLTPADDAAISSAAIPLEAGEPMTPGNVDVLNPQTIAPARSTVSQTMTQAGVESDAEKTAPVAGNAAGTGVIESGIQVELPHLPGTAPYEAPAKDVAASVFAASAKIETSQESSSESRLPSAQARPNVAETIVLESARTQAEGLKPAGQSAADITEIPAGLVTPEPEVNTSQIEAPVAVLLSAPMTAGKPAAASIADAVPNSKPQPTISEESIADIVTNSQLQSKSAGESVADSVPNFQPKPADAGELIVPDASKVRSETEAGSPATESSSPESSMANSIPDEISESAVSTPSTEAFPVKEQIHSEQSIDLKQGRTDTPRLNQDVQNDSTSVQSRQSDAGQFSTDPVPLPPNRSAAATQEAAETVETAKEPAASAAAAAESSKFAESSTNGPGPQGNTNSTRPGDPSAETQSRDLHQFQGQQVGAHKTDQYSKAMEPLNLNLQPGKGAGIPAETTDAVLQQLATGPKEDTSTSTPATTPSRIFSAADAPKEGQPSFEPTADMPIKTASAQALHTSETPKPAPESGESRSFSFQELSGRPEERAASDPVKPFRANPIEGQEVANQGLPGVTSPIDGKTAAMPKAAQPTNARPGEFMFELAGKIQTMVKAGQGEIRIQLRPEHLGNIEIKAENGIGGIVARIAAESANVKQFLENNLHSLQQSLQEQGLKVERIDIVVQEGMDLRHAGTHQQQSGQTGNGQQEGHSHASDGNARSTSSLSAEELLVDSVTAAVLGPNSTFHTIA